MSFREYEPNSDPLFICEHCGVVLSYFTIKQTKEVTYIADETTKEEDAYYEDWLVCPICDNEEKIPR